MQSSLRQALRDLFYNQAMRFATNILHIRTFPLSERGATAIEYAMIAGFVFVAIVGGVSALGQGVVDVLYNKIETLF